MKKATSKREQSRNVFGFCRERVGSMLKAINIIKWWKERRLQKRKLRETRDTLHMWAGLERLFESGVLSFDQKTHRLFITQPMATLLLANGADGWLRGVHNIYEYVHWRQTQQAFDEYLQQEELKAVRQAMQSAPGGSAAGITRDDIDRIKRTRRQEIAFTDMPVVKAEPFEFFIIPDSTEAKVEPLAVGYYDPDSGQMDVATWEEVRELVSATPNHV